MCVYALWSSPSLFIHTINWSCSRHAENSEAADQPALMRYKGYRTHIRLNPPNEIFRCDMFKWPETTETFYCSVQELTIYLNFILHVFPHFPSLLWWKGRYRFHCPVNVIHIVMFTCSRKYLAMFPLTHISGWRLVHAYFNSFIAMTFDYWQ